MIEIEFFETRESEEMEDKIEKLRESSEKVRKGIYAKHGELEKKYNDLLQRLSILELHIVKGIA